MSRLDRSTAGVPARFQLDRENGKFLGVCAGLADRLNVDPLVIRSVFVLGTLFGFGSFILIYFVIALLAG